MLTYIDRGLAKCSLLSAVWCHRMDIVSIMWQIEVELDVVIYNLELVRTGWDEEKGMSFNQIKIYRPGQFNLLSTF